MILTGPVIPRAYTTFNASSPTPTLLNPIPYGSGEIITCVNTGRMWVAKATTPGYTGAWVPLSLEYEVIGLSGTTTSGVKKYVYVAGIFNLAGVEITGSKTIINTISSFSPTTGLTTQGLTVGGGTDAVYIATSNTIAPNPIHINSSKASMSNAGFGSGVSADEYWLTCHAGNGIELADGTSTYRVNMKVNKTEARCYRPFVAEGGITDTTNTSRYLLGTSATGLVQDRGLTSQQSFIGADVTLTNLDTTYDVTSLTLAAGTWSITGQANFKTNVGTATTYALVLRDNTAGTDLTAAVVFSAGAALNNGGYVSYVVTLGVSSVIKLQARSSTTGGTPNCVSYQVAAGTGGAIATYSNASGLTAVRIA